MFLMVHTVYSYFLFIWLYGILSFSSFFFQSPDIKFGHKSSGSKRQTRDGFRFRQSLSLVVTPVPTLSSIWPSSQVHFLTAHPCSVHVKGVRVVQQRLCPTNNTPKNKLLPPAGLHPGVRGRLGVGVAGVRGGNNHIMGREGHETRKEHLPVATCQFCSQRPVRQSKHSGTLWSFFSSFFVFFCLTSTQISFCVFKFSNKTILKGKRFFNYKSLESTRSSLELKPNKTGKEKLKNKVNSCYLL